MKSNLLLNPFTRIAGWKAFFAGLVFALLSGMGGRWGVWFDGVLDAHPAGGIPAYWGYIMIAIDIACIAVVMWLAALVTSRSFRFIDILGTMTLARAPMLLMVPIVVLLTKYSNGTCPTLTLVLGLLTVALLIWYIILMYNGMKVSCNAKGWKFMVIFITGVIIAEVISKVALSLMMAKVLLPPAATA